MAIVAPEYMEHHHLQSISKNNYQNWESSQDYSYQHYANNHPTIDEYHLFIG
jgi:hypothetical protein